MWSGEHVLPNSFVSDAENHVINDDGYQCPGWALGFRGGLRFYLDVPHIPKNSFSTHEWGVKSHYKGYLVGG